MKVPMSWLKEWVAVDLDARALGARLTLAGFELEGVATAAPAFTGVVVAEILEASPHPQAEKLQVCGVSIGEGDSVQIVCGARNARAGLKTALATVGAVLPGALAIKAARLRGVESFGMLCSAKELGLADASDGILELDASAPLGADVRRALNLDDEILEIGITPNRGDAMSVLGIAREVAAMCGDGKINGPAIDAVPPQSADRVPVHLDWPEATPRFAGRVIRGVDNGRSSPAWLRERLRRGGIRTVSPVVDVTNYVLLELGQPMHVYDLAAVRGAIRARAARDGESIRLLDGTDIVLRADELVIADDAGPVGLAGIMGGERTAASAATTDIFLEAAWFSPAAIAGRGRRHGIHSDASQRFERGVDPDGLSRAIERATALILQIAGGQPGPVQVVERSEFLPSRPPVHLRRARLAALLGVAPSDDGVEQALRSLGMRVTACPAGWNVEPPSHRFDIGIEADLIEEVARLQGYEAIPAVPAVSGQRILAAPSSLPHEARLLALCAARGYSEIITFAFVDPVLQGRLFAELPAVQLENPIASDLSAMRVSLWPGLLRAAQENQRRQQSRIRLVEHGVVFLRDAASTREVDRIAGLACGSRNPEQWGLPRIPLDFFDVKADVEALLATTGAATDFSFTPAALKCLHPGRTAQILREGALVGWIGELHPEAVRALDLTYAPILFELDFDAALRIDPPRFAEVSRFPQVRRDLAIVVDEATSLSAVRERVVLRSSSLLRDLRVFDVYRGAGIESGRKSIALGLIFQDNSRTLTDGDADQIVSAIVADLAETLNARRRE